MWRHSGSNGSVTNQYRRTVEPPPPSCTLYPSHFHPLHFPAKLHIFYTPHLPNSWFSAHLISHTQQILHSALRVFHRTPIEVFVLLSNRPQKTKKSFFQALLGVLEFTPNTILVNDFYFGPKARSSACTAANRLFSRSVVVAAWPVQRRFSHCGKFQGSFKSRSTIDTNDKLCTRLSSLATNTSILMAYISYNKLRYTLD